MAPRELDVTLPPGLQSGIDEIVRGVSPAALERSAKALSDAYRAGGPAAARAARTPGDVAAYLAARAPATYASAAEVFAQVRVLRSEWTPLSLLDLGAGPGMATWAALEAWPGLTDVALVEAEAEMARAGQVLATAGPEALQRATWTVADAGASGAKADLVVVSYVIGELGEDALETLVRRAWERTADTLVIVEPGTTAGYRRTLAVREAVIAAGGSTLAPCPHDRPCPLPEGDWCHFAVRLPRSRAHRLAKGAERGFEDEKFAYTVLTRADVRPATARIIRRPEQNPGHVVFSLCTSDGLERRTIARRQQEVYRDARKRVWGDPL